MTLTGLVISFVGTLLVAFSIRKGKVRMYMDSPDEMEHAGKFNSPMLRAGLVFLALGFLLQIWGAAAPRAGADSSGHLVEGQGLLNDDAREGQMLEGLWNVLKSEAAAIGIILTILTALWASLRALAVKRRELRAQAFKTYHELIHTLVAKDARGENPKLDVQVAVVYELRRFPAYFDLSLGILEGLRAFWGPVQDPSQKRRDDEIVKTIAEIKRKSETRRHRLLQWFRNSSTY